MQVYNSNLEENQSLAIHIEQRLPKARAIIEFIEGDLSRAPVVFPASGNDETDEAIRAEIKRRWERAA